MKKIFLVACALGFLQLSGQQDVQFTQFMFNRIYYNPGVAGSGGAICITGLHRSQWVGFEGAPVTQNINANIPINALHGGIGVSIVNDQIGFFNNVSADLMYAYQIQLPQGTLGIGLGGSFQNSGLSDAVWIPADFNPDPTNPGGFPDLALPATDANGFQVDLTFGAYYSSETVWGGISTTRVIESSATVDNQFGTPTVFRNSRHYYIMGGYNWAIPGSNWELQPAVLTKVAAGSATVFDVNVMGVYNKKLWGGVTYRLQDAIGTMVGYQFSPAFRAGYSYDIATSPLSGSGSGSHEIMLQYCFKIEIPPRPKGRYRNIRFL